MHLLAESIEDLKMQQQMLHALLDDLRRSSRCCCESDGRCSKTTRNLDLTVLGTSTRGHVSNVRDAAEEYVEWKVQVNTRVKQEVDLIDMGTQSRLLGRCEQELPGF
uniref:Uncharacterized protein n=1 Tax=Peronospora matthiolae TaxID=2874970 RepID=A0AAV1TCV1_9STRA